MDVQPETMFKALADSTRWRTLGVLQRHELSVSELVDVLDQPQSTVSRHLRVLREAGLIRDRRMGSTRMYSVPTSVDGQNESNLRSRLMAWSGEQTLPNALHHRIDVVMERRRDMSRRFFDRVGTEWDTLREESFGGRFHLEALVALLPRDWTVADIGTGTGYLLPTLAGHFRNVLAVEPSERMLETARNRLTYERLDNVSLHSGDLTHLPLDNLSADVAIAMLVLHHVPAPRAALGELYRILKPGGSVLLVEQAVHDHEAFHHRMQDRWWGFDAEELVLWLGEEGFADVAAHRLSSVEQGDDAPALFVVTGRKAVDTFAGVGG